MNERSGFFARLMDLWRGFWGIKIRDAEARNAEVVYHNAVEQRRGITHERLGRGDPFRVVAACHRRRGERMHGVPEPSGGLDDFTLDRSLGLVHPSRSTLLNSARGGSTTLEFSLRGQVAAKMEPRSGFRRCLRPHTGDAEACGFVRSSRSPW